MGQKFQGFINFDPSSKITSSKIKIIFIGERACSYLENIFVVKSERSNHCNFVP